MYAENSQVNVTSFRYVISYVYISYEQNRDNIEFDAYDK